MASREELSVEHTAILLKHSNRLQGLQQARDIFKDLGGVMGASLTNTVNSVIGTETKRFRRRVRGDAAVAKELRTSMDAEEAAQRKRRAEFQEEMLQKRQKQRAARELQELEAKTRKAKKLARELDAFVTAKQHSKSFSTAQLGDGVKNAGGEICRKRRFEVLERVRAIGGLCCEQQND